MMRHWQEGKTLIVAEIGNNHEGDASVAERMLCEAAAAGADAVKFQTLRADGLVGRVPPERLRMLQGFELTFAEFEALARRAEQEGVLFLSTPFDLESARFLDDLVPLFKVASGDLTFGPLLDAVAGFGKPVLLSRGGADEQEIQSAVDRLRQGWQGLDAAPELVLLHCVSLYPTPPELANLAAIPALAARFGLPAGYSDHTLGVEAAVLAACLGARVIEKHFTLDHEWSAFRDHQLSADPVQMRELVRRVRQAEAYRGSAALHPSDAETQGVDGMRRSICAARDLAAGTVLAAEHLTWLRPGGGLAPGQEERLLGRILRLGVQRGQAFGMDMVE
ncbi:MAG: N-acetylneuraminate synthase family protein [Desulfovibrionaceae bacterium]